MPDDRAEAGAQSSKRDPMRTPELWLQHGPGSVRVCNGAHATEEGCRTIAEAEILGVPREIAVARARLIAAAPDLLAELRKLANESQGFLAMADRQTHGNTNIAILRMRIKEAFDAIAKAEGRS